MNELPKEYEKYDDETQEALSDLLESIDHIVHIMNGVRADIMNGNYHARQAESDYENMVYTEGVDVFSALEQVADSASSESNDDDESEMVEA